MPEHLTRKELKTDNVALTVESAYEYYERHKRQIWQIAGGVLIVIAIGVGIYLWMRHATAVRQEKLSEAMAVMAAPVGPGQPNVLSYPTDDVKQAAERKAFQDIAAQYGGSHEGAIAEYELAGIAVATGKNDEARKRYEQVVDSGSRDYQALAKLALAQLDYGEGKDADGEKLLRELMDHPTATVSKVQATVTLARLIAPKHPTEARGMLQPLVTQPGEVGQTVNTVLSQISGK